MANVSFFEHFVGKRCWSLVSWMSVYVDIYKILEIYMIIYVHIQFLNLHEM